MYELKKKKPEEEMALSAVDDVFGPSDDGEDMDFGDDEAPKTEAEVEVSKVEDPEEALSEIAGHLKMASEVIKRLGL